MSVVLLSSLALAACGGSGDSASVSTGSEDNFASTNPPPVDSSAKSDSAATSFCEVFDADASLLESGAVEARSITFDSSLQNVGQCNLLWNADQWIYVTAFSSATEEEARSNFALAQSLSPDGSLYPEVGSPPGTYFRTPYKVVGTIGTHTMTCGVTDFTAGLSTTEGKELDSFGRAGALSADPERGGGFVDRVNYIAHPKRWT